MLSAEIERLSSNKGLSIAELERQAGVGHGTVSKWQKSMPTLTSLKKVADVLGVTMADLVRQIE